MMELSRHPRDPIPDTGGGIGRGEEETPRLPWVVIVFERSSVNTFSYVIFVVQKLVGYSRAKGDPG